MNYETSHQWPLIWSTVCRRRVAMSLLKYFNYFLPEELRRKCVEKLKGVKWMNERASSDKAYVPTPVERVANIITHGIWVLPSILGCGILLRRSKSWPQVWSAVIYGLSLILCFLVSTSFHSVFYCSKSRVLKDVLHRGDRAMIYIFIAGSYFPWFVLKPPPTESWHSELWWIIWIMAGFGIIYQQIFHEKYKSLETFFYLLVGLGPSIVVLQYETAGPGEYQLKLGGALYVLGVVFFKSDGTIPFAHAIWHLFVAGAASIHYFAILNHLYS